MRRASVLLTLLLARTLAAQQPESDHEMIQRLVQRVNELEAEVQRLRTQPGDSPAQPREAATAAPPAATSQPTPEPAPPPALAAAAMPQDMAHDAAGIPGMQFRGFSDIQYHASDQKGVTDTFALGQLNLFITSKISDKINALAELVIEADPNNAFGIEPERLLLQYAVNDYLNLSLGRYHTAIGFYNTAYHHSTWMQTTVDRPFLFEFEDRGGILPIHNVGLSATGRIPSGSLGLHYVAEIGNGRTSRSPLDEPVQSVRDENNGKAFNLAVFARPDWLRGFQTGFSVYRDHLTPENLPKIGQTILSGHVVYQSNRFEFLNEVILMRHAPLGSPLHDTSAFYSQISRAFSRFRPYFRYEYINAPTVDPIVGDVGLYQGPVGGIRFDFAEVAAFKLEYTRIQRRDLADTNGLTTQVSFTF